jgi:hypothetical protein
LLTMRQSGQIVNRSGYIWAGIKGSRTYGDYEKNTWVETSDLGQMLVGPGRVKFYNFGPCRLQFSALINPICRLCVTGKKPRKVKER